jgi:hypothetical protein
VQFMLPPSIEAVAAALRDHLAAPVMTAPS